MAGAEQGSNRPERKLAGQVVHEVIKGSVERFIKPESLAEIEGIILTARANPLGVNDRFTTGRRDTITLRVSEFSLEDPTATIRFQLPDTYGRLASYYTTGGGKFIGREYDGRPNSDSGVRGPGDDLTLAAELEAFRQPLGLMIVPRLPEVNQEPAAA